MQVTLMVSIPLSYPFSFPFHSTNYTKQELNHKKANFHKSHIKNLQKDYKNVSAKDRSEITKEVQVTPYLNTSRAQATTYTNKEHSKFSFHTNNLSQASVHLHLRLRSGAVGP